MLGPLQLYVPPPPPVRVTFGLEQVITPPALAVGLGGVVLVVTFTLVPAEQPLLPSVTVKLYVPPAFTTGLAVVAPLIMLGPLQLYAPPPPPVSVTLGDEQVMAPPKLAVGLGGVLF